MSTAAPTPASAAELALPTVEVPMEAAEEWRQASARISEHITAVWGWEADEPEALLLADQFATGLWFAVSNTGTKPLTLLNALLAPKPGDVPA